MKVPNRILHLFDKYVSGRIERDEWDEMLDYFQQHGFPKGFDQSVLESLMRESDAGKERGKQVQALGAWVENRLRAELELKRKLQNRKRVKRLVTVSVTSVAAALLLFAGWYGMTHWNPSASEDPQNLQLSENDDEILPAGNRASLKLADGRIINLDESQQGILVDGQQVTYQDGSSSLVAFEDNAPTQSIMLSTPRGGTYHIILPDGTKVWLNAASTLTYPSRFTEHDRTVHLEGEAYFEVKPLEDKRGARPFRVQSANQNIEVLGTEFNVSAYADETIVRTTLVEGKVKVHASGSNESLLLSPGEQSRLAESSFSKISVNVNDYTDWKNGEFVFRNETTKQVLLRLSRWYDVELGQLSPASLEERFSGTISRYGEFQTVLDIMSEAAGLQFQLEGRTVHASKIKRINYQTN